MFADKKYIFFDLDGTISDPKEGITKAIANSLEDFGISVENRDDLVAFIGPPLRDSYKKFYGFNAEEAERAVAKYGEYLSGEGKFENLIYGGMEELLKGLKEKGKRLVVATAKLTEFANQTLEHFGIEKYFDFVAGSKPDGSRSVKGDVIRYALENLGISDVENAVMIGDREHDVIGARECGIDCVSVLYGYGTVEELAEAGAAVMVESVSELKEILV